MLSWSFLNREEYNSITEPESSVLYFIHDEGKIYKGKAELTDKISIYKDHITGKELGVLYLNIDSLEGKIFDGDDWQTVVGPISAHNVRTMSTLATPIDLPSLEDIKSEIIADLWNKMDRVAPEHRGEVLVADSIGNAKLSGYKIGGPEITPTFDENTLITESAAKHFIDTYAVLEDDIVRTLADMEKDPEKASIRKVISEKAAVESLTVNLLGEAPAEGAPKIEDQSIVPEPVV